MTKRIYCDTNIYLDFLLDRKNLYGKSLGDVAFEVFQRVMGCEFELVVSDRILVELKGKIDSSKLKMLFSSKNLKRKVVTVGYTEEDLQKAKEMSEHFQDALHVILALKANADVIVTRNLRDFLPYSHLIEIKLPENL